MMMLLFFFDYVHDDTMLMRYALRAIMLMMPRLKEDADDMRGSAASAVPRAGRARMMARAQRVIFIFSFFFFMMSLFSMLRLWLPFRCPYAVFFSLRSLSRWSLCLMPFCLSLFFRLMPMIFSLDATFTMLIIFCAWCWCPLMLMIFWFSPSFYVTLCRWCRCHAAKMMLIILRDAFDADADDATLMRWLLMRRRSTMPRRRRLIRRRLLYAYAIILIRYLPRFFTPLTPASIRLIFHYITLPWFAITIYAERERAAILLLFIVCLLFLRAIMPFSRAMPLRHMLTFAWLAWRSFIDYLHFFAFTPLSQYLSPSSRHAYTYARCAAYYCFTRCLRALHAYATACYAICYFFSMRAMMPPDTLIMRHAAIWRYAFILCEMMIFCAIWLLCRWALPAMRLIFIYMPPCRLLFSSMPYAFIGYRYWYLFVFDAWCFTIILIIWCFIFHAIDFHAWLFITLLFLLMLLIFISLLLLRHADDDATMLICFFMMHDIYFSYCWYAMPMSAIFTRCRFWCWYRPWYHVFAYARR